MLRDDALYAKFSDFDACSSSGSKLLQLLAVATSSTSSTEMVACCELLLKRKAAINSVGEATGFTALHEAARKGCVGFARALVRHKASAKHCCHSLLPFFPLLNPSLEI